MTNKKIKNAGFNLQMQAIIKEKYGIEVDDEFADFKAIMKGRKGKQDKPTYKEQKEVAKALQVFRAWSDSNNRKKVG